ncbi:hypothetical protein SMICM304S_01219 [Streptomyces microflavus]
MPLGGDGEVGAEVGALGDQEAEVEERPGDALGGALGAVGDQLTVQIVLEFDAELGLGCGDAPYRVGVVPGPHPDPCDVPQPGGRGAGGTEGVGDVLAVGPGLHQSGARHGRDAHRRPVPGDPGPGGGVPQHLVQPLPPVPPPGEQGVRGVGVDQGLRRLVDEGFGGGEGLGHLVAEPFRLGGRQQRDLVGPGEVGDLVGDGPPLGGGPVGPPARLQHPYQDVEFVALLAQIITRCDIGHVRSPRDRVWCPGAWQRSGRTIKHACMIFCPAPALGIGAVGAAAVGTVGAADPVSGSRSRRPCDVPPRC